MKAGKEEQIQALHAATTRLLRLARRGDGRAGVGPAQTSALSALAENGAMSVQELAVFEGVAHATMSRIVSALEAAGAVTKAVNPKDRRTQSVKLTEKGRRQHQAAEARRRQLIEAAVSLLKPESADDLAQVLTLMAERLTPRRQT
jgi:DNA-binding MarR family transcriptional regulator